MNKSILSYLQLSSFELVRLEIISNENFAEGKDSFFKPKLAINFSVLKTEHEWSFKIPFEININWSKECNYQYEKIFLSMSSVFTFPPETKEEEVKKFVPHVCLANLWGIARGILLQITGVFPGGTVLLPTINMVEAVKSALESKDIKKKKAKK